MSNEKKRDRKKKITFDDSSTMMPIMSLLVILIPLLIGNIAFFHFKSIEVTTPSLSSDPIEPEVPDAEKNKERNVILQLSMKVEQYAFDLIDEDTGDVISTLFIRPRKKDIKTIRTKLLNVKRTFPKLNTILVSVEEDVRYSGLVAVLDQCKFLPPEEGEEPVKSLKLVLIPRGGV